MTASHLRHGALVELSNLNKSSVAKGHKPWVHELTGLHLRSVSVRAHKQAGERTRLLGSNQMAVWASGQLSDGDTKYSGIRCRVWQSLNIYEVGQCLKSTLGNVSITLLVWFSSLQTISTQSKELQEGHRRSFLQRKNWLSETIISFLGLTLLEFLLFFRNFEKATGGFWRKNWLLKQSPLSWAHLIEFFLSFLSQHSSLSPWRRSWPIYLPASTSTSLGR